MRSFTFSLGIWLGLSTALNLCRFDACRLATLQCLPSWGLGSTSFPMTSKMVCHWSFPATRLCAMVGQSWCDGWKLMSPRGDPWWLVGPRLNNAVCWLVDGGLGTFYCDCRISRLQRFMAWYCVCIDSPLTSSLFERKWYCCVEYVFLFFCKVLLISFVAFPDGAGLYFAVTWSRLFHTFQVGSRPLLISCFISKCKLLLHLICILWGNILLLIKKMLTQTRSFSFLKV